MVGGLLGKLPLCILMVLCLCRHTRLDGTVKDELERQQIVEQYNKDEDIFCMLLTTQVRVKIRCKLFMLTCYMEPTLQTRSLTYHIFLRTETSPA